MLETPLNLLRRFWQRHAWLLVNLCIPIFPLLLIPLIDPRQPASQPEFIAAIVVYLLPTLWAWQVAAGARTAIRQEEELLEQVEKNGRDLHEKLKDDPAAVPINDQLWQRFLPDVQDQDGVSRTSVRMVQSLCHETTSGRFPPISTTSQIYAAEITDRIRRLRAPQTLAVRLGILGTFVGLLLALAQLGDFFSQASGDPTAVTRLVRRLMVAFGTSIAGLLAAIVIQLLGEALAVRYERVQKLIEDTVGRIVTVLAVATAGTPLMRTAESLAEDMKDHKRELSDHSDNVQRASRRLIRAVRSNANALKDGVGALNNSHKAMSDVFGNHNAIVAELREGLRQVSAVDTRVASALKEHLDSLKKSTEAMAVTSAEAMSKALSPVTSTLSEQNAAATSAVNALSRAAANLEELTSSVKAAITADSQRYENLAAAISALAHRRAEPVSERGWGRHALWATVASVLVLNAALLVYLYRHAG